MDILDALAELLLASGSVPDKHTTGVGIVAFLLFVSGLMFLGVSAVHHPVALLHFGLYFLAALLLACGVAYALFRMNITGSYRPGAFVLFVTAMAFWFVGAALWLIR